MKFNNSLSTYHCLLRLANLTMVCRRKHGVFLIIISFIILLLLYNSINLSNDGKILGTICSAQQKPRLAFCTCITNNSHLLTKTLSLANYTNDSSSLKCAITIKYQGRLGNLMGEYATLYALAKSNGRLPYILSEMHDLLKSYFDLSIATLDSNIASNIPWIDYVIHDWMSPEYNNISGMFIKLRGYPSSWTFYHHLRNEIKKEFTFKQSIITEAQNQLQNIKKDRKTSDVTYVGVHVRRGDYIEVMKRYRGVLAHVGYLKQAFAYYRNNYKNVVFVVCSDDLDWCKINIDNSLGDVYFCYNGFERSPGNDMALLTHCNHSIITIGTFGFWVAYLTGGEVVYLTNYTSNGSIFHDVFRYEAAYLPEWIGIPADLSSVDLEYNCTNRINISAYVQFSVIFIFLMLRNVHK